MKHICTLLAIMMIANNAFAQLISQFNWDNNPVTTAQYGPDALSVSGSATSSLNGTNGTNGLNAGLPKADIELVLPAASFNGIGGIDFQIDFQRDETRGDFITCGNSFAFGMSGGEIFVSFEVNNNPGGSYQIYETNLYAIPDDDIFRTYRFYYLPATGYAEILVNGNVVWNYYIGNPSNLNWPNNNNVIIGSQMDGNGNNKTIFDNVIIAEVYDSALPVEMSMFEANSLEGKVELIWETESELNNDYFTIQRSRDGKEFDQLDIVKGAGTTNEKQSYSYFDEDPLIGISYYQIVQTDFNGKSSTSELASVLFESKEGIFIFPNLLETQAELQVKLPFVGEKIQIVFLNQRGSKVLTKTFGNQDHLKLNAPSSSGVFSVQVIIDNKLYGTQKIVVR